MPLIIIIIIIACGLQYCIKYRRNEYAKERSAKCKHKNTINDIDSKCRHFNARIRPLPLLLPLAGHAAIDPYLLAAGPTAANPQQS